MNIVDRYIEEYAPHFIAAGTTAAEAARMIIDRLDTLIALREPTSDILEYIYIRGSAVTGNPLTRIPNETPNEDYEITFISTSDITGGTIVFLNTEVISAQGAPANLAGAGLLLRPGDQIQMTTTQATPQSLLLVLRKVNTHEARNTNGYLAPESVPAIGDNIDDIDITRHSDPMRRLGLNPVGARQFYTD